MTEIISENYKGYKITVYQFSACWCTVNITNIKTHSNYEIKPNGYKGLPEDPNGMRDVNNWWGKDAGALSPIDKGKLFVDEKEKSK